MIFVNNINPMTKQLLLIAICLFVNVNICIPQWLCVYSTDKLYGINVINKDTVFAVGKDKILKSIDGGQNWFNVMSQNFEANSISFANNNIGYVSGLNKILKTTDCGDSWTTLRTSNSWYRTISFLTTDSGIVHAYNTPDTILKTTDGGHNWYPVFVRTTIKGVQFFKCDIAYLLTDSIFKSNDYGNTWNYIPIDTLYDPVFNPIKSFGFFNQDIGFVNLQDGNYLKTLNGGLTWNYLGNSILPPYYWYYYYSSSLTNYYFFGWDEIAGFGSINHSNDGGFTWVQQKSGFFNGISFFNDTIGYAVDLQEGIYKTTNGGIVDIQNLNKDEESILTVYPNPTRTELYINCSTLKNPIITIYNTKSQLVHHSKLEISKHNSIPISNLANGIYFYSVISCNKICKVGKFVKTN